MACFKVEADREPTRDGTIEADGAIELSTHVEPSRLVVPERQDAEVVDERDADTPDNWIKRHPDMVRLTGRHPFNSEPPLAKLQEVGWVTPPALHVVRNHGSVPKISWEEHGLKITGVPSPCELSMEDLVSGKVAPVVSIPVTFICAGNRRKEQNMTKKTIGFHWGAAAVGNSVWTGVRLCDILAYLGVRRTTKEHRYVLFDGPQGELPQGKTGSYGTSIDMGWALDRERDVLLAFKQNGEWLTPDHGFPLRTILPGCIGGRMIKWLTTMHVGPTPSDNHYHFFDNRVLPPHVDAEVATKEGWWYKPEYMINSININSAMFEPRHNSVFALAHPGNKTLRVSGYAYTGGGVKIIRAEISLDGGKSWELTELNRPEDAIAEARGTDKHWCWAWWETEVDAIRLLRCEEIMCRGVDSNQNFQPMHLTWNVMGMLNNCIFRIKVHPIQTKEGPGVWFEHPTMPGSETGGWMTEDAGKFDPEKATDAAPGPSGNAPNRLPAAVWGGAQAGAQQPIAVATSTIPRQAGKLVTSTKEWLEEGIPMEEVEKHNHEGSAWMVVNDLVYDCTPYLEDHPGGASSILLVAGGEATEDFEAVHSKKAWNMLKDYYIGPLRKAEAAKAKASKDTEADVTSGAEDADPTVPFLKPRAFKKLPLVEKIEVSQDTRIFRFGLPAPDKKLGLPTGQHMFLRAVVGGEKVLRPYTPMTDDHTLGHVDLLVKVYFKNAHPKFPAGGKMSQHLESMKIGDTIEVKGPVGEFIYLGGGSFTWHNKPRSCKRINMIAGGTGITPCWQVACSVLREANDDTQVSLVYANQTPEDILMRKELDQLASQNPERFKLWYTVDRVPKGSESWKYDTGFVTEAMLRRHLFEPGEDTITVMCGPQPMIDLACLPSLQRIGHAEAALMCF